MEQYVPTKWERESAEAREALWNALGRRPDELFAIASALTAAEERGRKQAVEVLELMRARERVPSHVVLLMCAEGSIKGVHNGQQVR